MYILTGILPVLGIADFQGRHIRDSGQGATAVNATHHRKLDGELCQILVGAIPIRRRIAAVLIHKKAWVDDSILFPVVRGLNVTPTPHLSVAKLMYTLVAADTATIVPLQTSLHAIWKPTND